jgi:hypothetical protein
LNNAVIAMDVLEQLFYTPVVSIGQIAGQFAISKQVAFTIVSQLAGAGILRVSAQQLPFVIDLQFFQGISTKNT